MRIAGFLIALLAAQLPAFDITSVKVNTSGSPESSVRLLLPDGFSATNQPLLPLLTIAFQMPEYRITGGPAWISTDRFDITAKSAGRVPLDRKWAMLRALLEDRFKLKTRLETREGRVFALTVARRDGRLGPAITPTTSDCASINAKRQQGEGPPAVTNGLPLCAIAGSLQLLRANGATMNAVALRLGNLMHETVIDRTGVTGSFDFELRAGADFPGAPAGAAGDAPSIFTALQEQLGLKLETTRGPIEVLVIESVEHPLPD